MAPMQSLLVRIIDTVLIFFASLVTGVTPKRPAELVFSPRAKVYYANHNSHGDFVLVWTALPKRWRLVEILEKFKTKPLPAKTAPAAPLALPRQELKK